jgi:two-component system, sporulation sensor kinase B
MFNYFGQFLYHVLIVLFPIFFYHLYLQENHNDRKKTNTKFALIVLFMLFCTMSYPIEYKHGYIYDFRVIPIMISFLYAGLLQGTITLSAMLIYRFILGGPGFYITFINYLILAFLLILIYRKFDSFKFRTKMILVSSLYWFIACTRGITLLKAGQFEQIPFMLTFGLIAWFSLITVFFIIENLDQQMKIQNQLQRADKLNVISQLAASVAHEVRNPMTSVRGFLQLMRTDENLDSKQRKYIDISLKELEHAQFIINDYLSLAKPNDKNPTIINLAEEIKNTIDLMTSYTNINNVTIESSIENSLYIKGLKDEIKQVLVNIMKNGIEAVDQGGIILVNAYTTEDEIVIEISDNGKGMTKTQLKYIGTPFYSTKDKGTGVGLTVSYQIINSMKGKIQVESIEGMGTKFIIKFPLGNYFND